jgi:hypothetical protein
MSFGAIVRGRLENPDRILIDGIDGIGKPSWAAAAPLLARWETVLGRNERGGVARGVASGARVVETVGSAAWDAKNRCSPPPPLRLDWVGYVAARQARRSGEPPALRASIVAKLRAIHDARLTIKVLALVKEAGDDTEELARIDRRMAANIRSRKAA